jgi:hypothetical protein
MSIAQRYHQEMSSDDFLWIESTVDAGLDTRSFSGHRIATWHAEGLSECAAGRGASSG